MRLARCRCGSLTAVCQEEPTVVSVCHCLECQRRTGSAFAVQARFSKASVKIEGTYKTYERVGESGLWARYHFCPDCGSTVFYENEDIPDAFAVPIGGFADPGFPQPTRSIFEERRHQWVSVTGTGIDHQP